MFSFVLLVTFRPISPEGGGMTDKREGGRGRNQKETEGQVKRKEDKGYFRNKETGFRRIRN